MADGTLLLILRGVICLTAFAEHDLTELQVAMNEADTCFGQFGQVVCFGANSKGQLGREDTDDIGKQAADLALTLTPIDFGEDFVVKFVAGGSCCHHCALSVGHKLKCWGACFFGMCAVLHSTIEAHIIDLVYSAHPRPTGLRRH